MGTDRAAHAGKVSGWPDGAPSLLSSIRSAFPWLRHVFADGGYAGEKLEQSLVPLGNWTIDIVKRSDIAKGFMGDQCRARPVIVLSPREEVPAEDRQLEGHGDGGDLMAALRSDPHEEGVQRSRCLGGG